MDSRNILLATSLLALAGCGRSYAPGAPLDGGTIVMFAEPEGLVFSADVYSSASAGFPMPGTLGCQVTPHTLAGTRVIHATDLDLGASLNLLSCAGSLDAPLETGGYAEMLDGRNILPGGERFDVVHDGAIHEYLGGFAGVPAFGSTWSVNAAGGTTLATITLPEEVVQDPAFLFNGSITPGVAANVAWTGGAGAQFFHVFAAGDDASADCYVPADASSFELPGTITAALGAGAFAQVSAESVQVIDVAGRPVLVVSGADNLD